MTVRQFAIVGSLAVGDRQVFIAQGAHADDLPPDAAGLIEIAERVRCQYGQRSGDPATSWIEVHIWETDPLHQVLHEWHLDPAMRASEVPPPLEATR